MLAVALLVAAQLAGSTEPPMSASDPEVVRHLTALHIRAGSPPDVRQRDRALAWLLEHAERAWPVVRARADEAPHDPVLVDLIARMRRADATALLERAFGDPRTRPYAAAGLGLSPDPAARALLRRALASSDAGEAAAALAGLGASGESSACADVMPFVASPAAELRWAAVDAGSKLGCLDRAALERIAQRDPDETVRSLAADKLRAR